MIKKKGTWVKFMSMLLALVVMIGIFPMSASAKGYDFEKDYKDLGIRFWEDEQPDIGFYIDASAKYILETVTEPAMGSTFGEWSVMDLLRGMYTGYDYINHIPDNYFEDYLGRIEDYVVGKKGNLDRNKSTEWSRLMLTLSSLGYDVSSVARNHEDAPEGGYDFIEKLTASHRFSYRQGINGPIWEIIAMNTGGYIFYDQAENDDVNTFGKMINYILDKEIKKGKEDAGGWALMGETPDPDITGMALQALAPYYLDENLYKSVRENDSPEYVEFASYVERAIYVLSKLQQENGGYNAWGNVNAESIVQVIVALTALNIDPLSSEVNLPHINKTCSFIKAGGDRDGLETNNMIDALLTFWAPGSGKSSPEVGGFRHVTSGNDGGGGSGTGVNAMATDQALYGLIAYDRYLEDQNGLYDMTDMVKGEYRDLVSKEELDLKSYTISFVLEDDSITERESPYAAIELPTGKNVNDKVFKNWNTKEDGSGTSYKAGEYLSMPKKNITLYAQYRHKEEYAELKEVHDIHDLVVNVGKREEEVKNLLAQTTTIMDSDNEIYEVELEWTVKDYDESKIGQYEAVGTFVLPDGVKNTDESISLEVKAIIRVSQEIPKGDLEFSDGTITGYTGEDKDVVIPDKIDGVPVISIGKAAFENKNLNTIFIPESVTTIGENAFKDNDLKEVNIPDSITTIGKGAFENNELAKIKFPKGLRILASDAFRNNKLTEINIPTTLQSLGAGAFRNNKLIEISIPNQITIIQANTFYDNEIERVILPSGLTEIGSGAFAKNNLTDLKIPDSVTTIGNNAFGENFLKNVSLGNKLEKIELNAFKNNQLMEIDIPQSVNTIGSEAFAQNKMIEGMARIDNYKSEVEVRSNAFNSNGEDKNTNIQPIFLKDLQAELKISEVELMEDNKLIAEGKFNEDNSITIQLPEDFPEKEIDKLGLGSYTLVIKGIEGSSIKQAGGASGDWSEGKANTVAADSPTIFTIEKYGIEKEYRITIISPVRLPSIESIEKVDDLEVDYGTSIKEVKNKLPEKITLKLSDQSVVEVDVTWTKEEYDGNNSGEYTFVGEYNLPEGVTGEKLIISVKVTVKEEAKPVVDKSELEKKIAVAKLLSEEIYTEESWTTLFEKLESATPILANEEATQTQVDLALEELISAIAGLEEKAEEIEVDKTKLKEKIGEVKDLKKEDYTKESWSAFQKVLEEAIALVEKDDATLGEVDQVLASLIVAIEKLEEKPEEVTIVSIKEVSDIKVDFATSKEDTIAKLPEEITLKLSDGNTKQVSVNWISEEYDSNKSGEYEFMGEYDLPEGISGDKLIIKVKVTVNEKTEEPEKPTDPEEVIEATPLLKYEGKGDRTTIINLAFERFIKLMEDGVEVDPKNYIAEKGSTIITLKESYLDTLKNGTHKFTAVFDGIDVDLSLEVAVEEIVEPTEPTEPDSPEKPTEPTKPTEPEKPTQVEDDEKPVVPEEPGKPGNSGDTGNGELPDSPKTGSSSPIGYLIAGFVVSVLGIILLRKEEEKKEKEQM